MKRLIAKPIVQPQLTKALKELSVNANTVDKPDPMPRTLTLDQLRGLTADTELLKPSPKSVDALIDTVFDALAGKAGVTPAK